MALGEHSIHINRPLEEVFAYATDSDKLKGWQGDLVDSHADGPTRLGARATQVRSFLGQRVEVTSEITAFDPPNRMAMKSLRGGMIEFTGTLNFKAMEAGTQFTLSFDLVHSGMLKIAEGVFANQVSKSMERDLVTLKQILEA